MKSHQAEFKPADLMSVVGGPLLVFAVIAAVLHAAARLDVLPAPRPALDVDRTIIVHQAESARRSQARELILIGDSSCLMDVSARHLGRALGRSALNLGTLSYLDPAAYGRLLGEFTRRHSPHTVVLLMHPEALRRLNPEAHHLALLTNYLAGRDGLRFETASDTFEALTGVEIAGGRLLARLVPTPLRGVYGAYYGFAPNLERFMDTHDGSAVDPGRERFSGNAEYRLASSLRQSSAAFRAAVPGGTRLLVGMTPIPAGFAPPGFTAHRNRLLDEWAGWLRADAVLTELPAVLPDDQFARVTHLNPAAATNYTDQLAAILRRHLTAP